VRASETSKEPELLRESLPYYQYVWEHGDAREVLVARSNYAAASVRLGEAAIALQAYQDGYPTARRIDDATVRSRYINNFARLTEAEVGIPEALPLYLEAFESDPTYAAPALFGVRAAVKSGLYRSARGLLARLFDNGHVQAGGEEITSLLAQREVVSWPGSDAIAEALFDYLAAARPGFDEFAKTLQPILEDNLDAMAPDTRARVSLVLLSYVGGDKLPRIIDPPEARARLTPWIHNPQDSRQAAIDLAAASRFVTTAGELHARAGRLDDALTRYLLAWALDTTNLSAALYAANLLLDHAETLDPDRRWLDEFVFWLFEGKGEAYLGEDWPAIYRFHTVLGTIYWRQQNWGSSGNVRSAVFQLEHALAAKDRIRDRRERAAPVGRLHLMLADAYAGIGQNAAAFDSYVRAVREGLARDDRDTAEEALARVQDLDFTPTPQDRRMLDEIRLRLRRS
jgi:tetratricopeptide (TPR) repeat protein